MKRQTAHTETATAMLMRIAKAAFLPFTRGGGGVALVALAIALAACNSGGGSSNNNPTKTPSAKAELLSLKINDGDTDHTVDITGNTGEVRDVPQGKPLTIGEITISSGATAKITTADTSSDAEKGEPITLNSNNEFSITITAEDKKTTQTYTISVGFIPNENAKLTALHLRADGVDYTVDIDGTDGSVTLPYSPDRPALTIASIAISQGATAALADDTDATADAHVSLDENNQFTITVTAGNATSAYTITIATAPNDEAELLSLKVNDGATDYTVDISTDKTGAVHVPHNTDLASLTIGTITISDNATSSPARNERVAVNSSNQFSITVTAEDTTTTATYTISITLAPSDEAELLSLHIAGKAVEFAGITGKVTLLYGTVLADVTIDSISLSDDATADFSNGAEAKAGATIPALNNKQFTITVTAEDGTTTADYSITIDDTPTLAVTGHYDEQRIGAGDFDKTDLLQIGNVQNGEWSYAISVTGSDENNAALTLPSQTPIQMAMASDSSFDTNQNPLSVAEWKMLKDGELSSINVTLSRSNPQLDESSFSFTNIAKEQYQLKSWQDVQAINHDLAGDYTLMHDITFPEPGTDGMPAAGFEPIGEWKSGGNHIFFTGSLNGNGHTLHNLFINRNISGVGLFAVLGTGASIDSLSLVLHADGIRGDSRTGGLVGYNFGSISHSDVSGDVSVSDNNVGGLVGYNFGGRISQSYATGDITGINKVGGLTGFVDNGGHISHSYASGNVVATHSFSEVGGLIGAIIASSTISNSYATGDVNGDRAVGGLIGFSNEATHNNSYASGRVTANSSFGGLLGSGFSNTNNSYWDNTVNHDITGGAGTGTSTADMKMQSTYSDWDFTSDWGIDASINNGYPYLRGVGPQPAYAKQLLALSLQADTTADAKIAIDEGSKTGAAQLPTDTDTANIRIAYIWIAGASASLAKGDTVTISNNSFSITVTAEDGATQDYAITITLQ